MKILLSFTHAQLYHLLTQTVCVSFFCWTQKIFLKTYGEKYTTEVNGYHQLFVTNIPQKIYIFLCSTEERNFYTGLEQVEGD